MEKILKGSQLMNSEQKFKILLLSKYYQNLNKLQTHLLTPNYVHGIYFGAKEYKKYIRRLRRRHFLLHNLCEHYRYL